MPFDANGHTPQCNETQRLIAEFQQEWDKAWPHYCHKCEGWGVFVIYQTRYSPQDLDVCECYLHYLCPRCGQASIVETECTNPRCLWTGFRPGDHRPEQRECSCDYLYGQMLSQIPH